MVIMKPRILTALLAALGTVSVPVAFAQTVVTGQFYGANTFRDDDGNEIGGVNALNIWANRNTVLWMTGRKLLRADFAVALALPFANLAPNPVLIDGVPGSTGVGLTDVPIAPLILSSGIGFELQFPAGKRVSAKLRGGADFGARNVSEGPFVVVELNIPLKTAQSR